MCIKWGKINSDYSNVSNGVRQGGVLSPKLFAIYIDDLSNQLAYCVNLGAISMNNVICADDRQVAYNNC